MEKMYVAYDERAMIDMDTSEAMVICMDSDLEELKDELREDGYNAAIFSYNADGNKLKNELFEEFVSIGGAK